MKLSPRHAAVKLLLDVLYKKGFSNRLFESVVAKEVSWNGRDRAFLKNLSYGVLRRLYVLDALLMEKCSSPFEKLPDAIKTILRTGLYQIAFMDRVPLHAAVSESVTLAKRYGHGGTAKLVNAIMRRFAAERKGLEKKIGSFSKKTALYTSHPEWLAQRYVKEFGKESAAKILNANNEEPPPNFRVANRRALDDAVEASGIKMEKNNFADAGVELSGPSGAIQSLIADGVVVAQDQSSIIAASLFCGLAGKSGRVLELCCGRGVKSGAIRKNLGENTVLVSADLSYGKLKRFKAGKSEALNRVCCDMLDPLPFGKEFNSIFIDAPCSNLGTVRRHPEIRYGKSEEDVTSMAALQLGALMNASAWVEDGGTILYAVCSMEAEETAAVAENFLSSNPVFSAVDIGAIRPDIKGAGLVEGGYLRILTGMYGMDGFFAAIFKNTASGNTGKLFK